MSEIDFSLEWVDPMSARGPELRATWARLELAVDGEPITRLLDLSSRSVRSSIYLPIYPLAEWIVTNWWFLFFELETPGRFTEKTYFARHNIRSGADGYALPSLSIRPVGGLIRLDWRPIRLPLQRLEFVSEGSAVFEVAYFQEFLTKIIVTVLQRMEDFEIFGTLLQEEWNSIATTDASEAEFCAASAALGLDPYALDDASQAKILSVSEILPASVSQEFFTAADFAVLGEQAQRLLDAIEISRTNEADLTEVKQLQKSFKHYPSLAGTPWQQGYELARRLRNDLGLNGQVLYELSDVGRALSLEPDDLVDSVFETPSYHSPFDALVDVNDRGSPGFVISSRRSEAVKFAYCRGLFEYLTCSPGEPLLVTKTRSERQKRNRAFAAEFLVPASALRSRLARDVVGEEEIDDLAADFGVTSHVIIHQLQNHKIARFLPS
jgi:hypothetical protein